MKHSALLLSFTLAAAVAAAACSSSDGLSSSSGGSPGSASNAPGAENSAPAGTNDPYDSKVEVLPDPLEGLPTGQKQLDLLCARGDFNAVTDALCNKNPTITSIVDLQRVLGLGFKDTSKNGANAANGNPGFALLGHSSSLIARDVSAINPRAFVFSPTPGQPVKIPGYVIMGATRGEPFVEIAAANPNNGKLNFYLFRFNLTCESSHSCKPGDLLTPAVERNWQGWSVYDDEDLKNTLADCRHCHQPDGPGSPLMLRMQEIQDPWTHWFRNDRPGGIALFQDFLRAHGDQEDYGGIPAAIIQKADGRALEDVVTGQGFGNQPNQFDSKQIESEVQSSSSVQPLINIPQGQSSTWQQLFDASVAGLAIPPPYHDVKVTDPNKLQYVTDQYKAFVAGQVTELPDIRRVFLDDALVDMTMKPKPGLSGKQVLVQMCAQCHNPNLDQSISRAKFDVTRMGSMSSAEKAETINRLKLPASNRLHMPPAMMRNMTPDALNAAIAELSK
jgi:cytochrome c553